MVEKNPRFSSSFAGISLSLPFLCSAGMFVGHWYPIIIIFFAVAHFNEENSKKVYSGKLKQLKKYRMKIGLREFLHVMHAIVLMLQIQSELFVSVVNHGAF